MMKERLTVILGAGSTIDLDFPSTSLLTIELLSMECKNYIYEKIFCKLACHFNDINGLLKKARDNEQDTESHRLIIFEDLLFTAEELYFCTKNKSITLSPHFKQHIGAFIDNNADLINNYDSKDYIELINKSLKIIRDKMVTAIDSYNKKNETEYSWHEKFWLELAKNYSLDIISLNYDNLFEKNIFAKDYNNGFVKIDDLENLYKFDNQELLSKTDKHRIIRLHGSVNFEHFLNMPDNILDKYKNNLSIKDLFWCDDMNIISSQLNNIQNTSPYCDLAIFKDSYMKTAIVAGYNKIEKFFDEPYRSYYSILPQLISENKNLLVIGYAFNDNDLHLNSIIGRLHQYHKGNEKVVIIDKDNIENKIKKLIYSINDHDIPMPENAMKMLSDGFKKNSNRNNEIIEFYGN